MGVRFPSVASATIVTVNPPTGTESVLVTTPQLIQPIDGALIFIEWYALMTLGTVGATFTVRLRRGTTITGTVVNVPTAQTCTASTTVSFAGCYIDTPGNVSGQQYSLTFQGAGGGTAHTTDDVCIQAFAL